MKYTIADTGRTVEVENHAQLLAVIKNSNPQTASMGMEEYLEDRMLFFNVATECIVREPTADAVAQALEEFGVLVRVA